MSLEWKRWDDAWVAEVSEIQHAFVLCGRWCVTQERMWVEEPEMGRAVDDEAAKLHAERHAAGYPGADGEPRDPYGMPPGEWFADGAWWVMPVGSRPGSPHMWLGVVRIEDGRWDWCLCTGLPSCGPDDLERIVTGPTGEPPTLQGAMLAAEASAMTLAAAITTSLAGRRRAGGGR